MVDLRRSRTATSTRTRSRSRPSRTRSPPGLNRVLSSQFPDDYSVYHQDEHSNADARSVYSVEAGERTGEDPEDETESTSEESEKDDEIQTDEQDVRIEPIKVGNEKDVEARPIALEKKKSSRSTRSVKDPNVVCIFILWKSWKLTKPR